MSKTPLRRSGRLERSAIEGGKPEPRAGKLAPKSAKTAARDREYSKLRAIWLDDRCAGAGVLEAHDGPAVDVHHMKGRGRAFMLDVSTWAALCRSCHTWVEANPEQSRLLGFRYRANERIPAMSKFSRCKSCGRPIYWATTTAGKSIPLIGDPDLELPLAHADTGKAGRCQEAFREILIGGELGGICVAVLGDGDVADHELPVWLSHFVDCPHANEHRKGRA